jgi:sugar phosphate isomerase/epimerase
MRLGGPLFGEYGSPEAWVDEVSAKGYRAAYCPVGPEADDATVRAYAEAAQANDIVIAEVGAWSNPLSPDARVRADAVETCKQNLQLADAIGARCCVNIVGSRGPKWDGPSALDLTEETFDMIVEVVRDIIDSINPTRSCYALETMPWMYPDSADSYVRLLRAIDRPACAAHLDPVNLICSPQRFFQTAAIIEECFAKLGPHIRSCHAKDIALDDRLTVHLDEVRPGLGGLDYPCFLRELNKLEKDVPLMLEHLPDEEEYRKAAEFIRHIARDEDIAL